ncbi:hypothetical protein ACFSE1_03890 [Rhizobium helianthi]|uniref:Uncharacterized protein n=1 Tax=Rhizobium helianthi TaxID=1132695 RepID=A0ABW4M0A7_9HYPH
MAFFFRFLSLLCLLAAIAAGTVDSIASVASSRVTLTSFETDWISLSASSLALVKQWVEYYIHPEVWRSGAALVIAQPAFAVLLGLSLLFWMIGYRRRRPEPLLM